MSSEDVTEAARPAHHELKSWPDNFGPVWARTKQHEVRRDDRDFHAGDTIALREFLPGRGLETGRWVRGVITHVTRSGPIGSNCSLPPGIVVFSFTEHARHGEDL